MTEGAVGVPEGVPEALGEAHADARGGHVGLDYRRMESSRMLTVTGKAGKTVKTGNWVRESGGQSEGEI